jgi:predicted DNA-binding transcriptional regulator AlpA
MRWLWRRGGKRRPKFSRATWRRYLRMKEVTQWSEVLSEREVLEVFAMKKGQLDRLRNARGFPFVRITSTSRVYLFPDVAEWLCKNRRKISEDV